MDKTWEENTEIFLSNNNKYSLISDNHLTVMASYAGNRENESLLVVKIDEYISKFFQL